MKIAIIQMCFGSYWCLAFGWVRIRKSVLDKFLLWNVMDNKPTISKTMGAANETQLAGERSILQGKRIIILVGNLMMGGTERQALRFPQFLGYQESAVVEFWGLGGHLGPIGQACEAREIPWRTVPVNWFTSRKDHKLRQIIRLGLELRHARPDVILSYLIVPNVVCSLVWRWTGAQLCVWNQRCAGTDRLGSQIERIAVARAPLFIANSHGGAEFL